MLAIPKFMALAASVAAVLVVSAAAAQPIGRVTPVAKSLIEQVDQLDVENHWPAGVHVEWRTGNPDGRPVSETGKHTHCSAFVAAAAEKVGVYILRPPEHSQILLANAQYAWLAGEGAGQGWVPVSNAIEAQKRANEGWLVLAAYQNHNSTKPGNIAIVRPSDRDEDLIRRDGPLVTQAGETNYRSTSLRQGFAGHPAAWERQEVVFYAHRVAEGGSR